ncbi:MAG: HtaA domain-containing protein [Arthrobacter sp.]|nr:HtaA domain-containing protein [Arthrobacter sp.]
MTPGLTWNVKDSFVSYVEALDDGAAEALAPASRAETGFFFPLDPATDAAGQDAAPDTAGPDTALQFLGAVRFAGHWGALDVELRDPRIELLGGRGTLLVRERGGRDPLKSLPFATLEASQRAEDADGSTHLELTASLTGQGHLLLGGQYPVGQPLSPLHVIFPASDA